MVAWPSGQKLHIFAGGSRGAGSNPDVATSIFFFFSFIVLLPIGFLLFIFTADSVSFARFLRKRISSNYNNNNNNNNNINDNNNNNNNKIKPSLILIRY